jgi:hypothetical protein
MTETQMVLSMFSALAVLAVGVIVAAALWARSSAARERRLEPAYEMSGREPSANNGWLIEDNDAR